MITFFVGVLAGLIICAAGLILAITARPDDDLTDQPERTDTYFDHPFGGGV